MGTFPKDQLATWTNENNAAARKFFANAFDRAEVSVNRREREVFNVFFDSLHEREARFNQHIAEEVLKGAGLRR